MEVRINEPMMKHTSFRAGGAARWFVVPETAEELKAVLAACRKADTPWYVIGNGSRPPAGDERIRRRLSDYRQGDLADFQPKRRHYLSIKKSTG